ncbi:MAG TPA: thioredoxin fold domain-containing protein, partial [Ignavibacteria bacterium]|nr:thioredoxin fold domain-containing protein [Ignavibacteria bacterium]
MRTKTIITCLMFAAATVFSQGIQFTEGTWQSVKDKAAAENKLIMVDAFADWCVPCKMMAKDVFTKSEVGEFYNSTFINYQIDAEKGEGVDFAKEYQIEFYPTILYIDGSGKVVEKKIGAMSPELFLAAGKNVANPETRFSTLEEKYKAGD